MTTTRSTAGSADEQVEPGISGEDGQVLEDVAGLTSIELIYRKSQGTANVYVTLNWTEPAAS